MSDEPEMQADPIDEPEGTADDMPYDEPEGELDETAAILAESQFDRMRRQAYWHGTSKQLFAFLFANCLFFAGVLVAWTRSVPGDPPGDPSTYITGLHTIRGAFLFALAIYGFWTAVFNVWHGQMKIWPYVLGAVLALWVGIAGFVHTIGSEEWDRAREYLNSEAFGSKTLFDDLTVPLSTVAPGYWLLTFGGLVVVFVIINGLLHGSKSAKAAAAESGGGSSRRRR